MNRQISRFGRLDKLTKPAADQRMAATQQPRHGDRETVLVERFTLVAETYCDAARRETKC